MNTRIHMRGATEKTAYTRGVDSALQKFALEPMRSSPEHIAFQQPTTTPEGRSTMIDQAFNTNAQLGEYGQAPDGPVAATNHSLSPGLAGAEDLPRRFANTTDQSGGYTE